MFEIEVRFWNGLDQESILNLTQRNEPLSTQVVIEGDGLDEFFETCTDVALVSLSSKSPCRYVGFC